MVRHHSHMRDSMSACVRSKVSGSKPCGSTRQVGMLKACRANAPGVMRDRADRRRRPASPLLIHRYRASRAASSDLSGTSSARDERP